MDHTLVKRLRGEVGARLAEQRRLDASGGQPPMSGEDERQFARALKVHRSAWPPAASTGSTTWPRRFSPTAAARW